MHEIRIVFQHWSNFSTDEKMFGERKVWIISLFCITQSPHLSSEEVEIGKEVKEIMKKQQKIIKLINI